MSVWDGRPARAKSPLYAERDQIGVGRESFPVRWRHHPGIRVLAITSTFVAALFAPALAAEAQLVPLQDYIGQSRVEKDPVALGYVAERCSALYSVFGKNLEGETDPERQRVMAEAFNAGERFMGLAVKLMISGTTMCGGCPAANSKNVADLGNLYIDRIEAARLRTGNMFRDHLIVGDFATCKGLLAKL